jgi:hypothetical protein
VGWTADFSLSKPRAFTAPFDGPDAAGRNLLLVAFGVGIADLVHSARRAANAGQKVKLVYATRNATDAILLPELTQLAKDYAPHVVAARQSQPQALPVLIGDAPIEETGGLMLLSIPSSTEVQSTAAAAVSVPRGTGSVEIHLLLSREAPPPSLLSTLPQGMFARHSRVSETSLADLTQGWDKSISTVHAVGGKVQKRETLRVLQELGFESRLLPIINNTSRYF